MKSILIPVEDHAAMESVLETALRLTERFGTYMEGVALGPDLAQITAADFSLGGIVFDERTRRELLDDAHDIFSNFMEKHGIGAEKTNSSAPSFGWRGETLATDEAIGEYGRVFDIIAVGRPASGIQQPRKSTLEWALFECGRPVLIAPPRAPTKLGERIAIAWNASSETARTVAFAMPLLLKAQDVPVMMVPGTRLPGPDENEIVANLRRHGIPARTVIAQESSKGPGRAVLETARSLGVDLLVKGGYTQSRIRQLIFGGPTSQILADADLPVFMAH
ncbi:MAG: universal stress protein [Methylovirgula sp.]|jgi:nucleotide-binding universal stress UspA family protein